MGLAFKKIPQKGSQESLMGVFLARMRKKTTLKVCIYLLFFMFLFLAYYFQTNGTT